MNNVNEYMRINEEFNIFLENINFSLIKKNECLSAMKKMII